MPVLNTSELLGKLHTGVKQGKIANTASKTDSPTAIAGWIVANVYDVENGRRENRQTLLECIAQAMAHYKGDI